MDGSYLSAYPFDMYNIEILAFAQDVLTNTPVDLMVDGLYDLISGIKTRTDIIQDIHFSRIYVFLQHSTLVIVYCVIITVTFWMVTLMICLIMIAIVFFHFRQRNEIVVASMPGAPEGFGDTLDFVGLLPCLILLSISAITMVGVYLFANPDDPTCRTFTWTELSMFLQLIHFWKNAKGCLQRAQFGIMRFL
ncbi:hypothetical protein EDD18DRAFT_1357731 [Armillaria luteobubalina]|uniref:Uncharacterized protein n=1 Tax=Armillaria luteobubalina TaxID=153913 RepID=A0AA39PXP8_9AGAR|nr:hypothetical protein EDD18DRAFT_1357731 [Armillaria luteobubalina]